MQLSLSVLLVYHFDYISSHSVRNFKFHSYLVTDNEDGTERLQWEEEQRNLDRAWYDLDAGYDEYTNPFAQVSEDYVKKKEDALKLQKKKRKSARARQTQKVRRDLFKLTLSLLLTGFSYTELFVACLVRL